MKETTLEKITLRYAKGIKFDALDKQGYLFYNYENKCRSS